MAMMKEKSRREIRKEARLEKKKKRSDSWVKDQKLRTEKNNQKKKKRKNRKKNGIFLNKSPNLHPQCPKDGHISPNNLVSERLHSLQPPVTDKSQLKIESSESTGSSALKGKGLSKGDKYPKTKFEEFLEMDMQQGVISRDEDLELERKLAKKLKVKDGKLGGVDDDINFLIEGTSSEMDFEEVHKNKSEDSSSLKKSKKRKLKEKESEGVAEKNEKRKKTKFEKYLEMHDRVPSADADLYMEKKLAKKLKVKKGKLKGGDDGIDELVDGIPSIIDLSDSEGDLDGTVIKKPVKEKSSSKFSSLSLSTKTQIKSNQKQTAMVNPLSLLIAISLLISAVSAASPPPTAAVDCSSLVISMVDCLSFVSDNSTVTKPAGTCCTGLKSVMKANPDCLCEAFKNSAQLGVSLNVTKALTLPSACHVSSPDLNNCQVSHGTVAPAMSPKSAMSPKASPGIPTTTGGSTKFAPAPAPKKSSASGLTTSIGSFLAIAVALVSFT